MVNTNKNKLSEFRQIVKDIRNLIRWLGSLVISNIATIEPCTVISINEVYDQHQIKVNDYPVVSFILKMH